jgi:Histone deacetylase domain
MHKASTLAAGATLAAARAVWSGSAQHGASIVGGMHHAMAAHSSGFCVCNDVAVAIAWLLEQGAERIGYVDIDAHHGDGVQAAFWDDPRVLTISLHQHPATLFPFTGRARRDRRAPPPRAPRSTSRCPPGPAMAPCCVPSTRSSRRCCGRSGRRSWSASTAPTPTGSIR